MTRASRIRHHWVVQPSFASPALASRAPLGGGDDVATGCPSWQEEACGLSADQVLDATLAWEGVAGLPVNGGTPCAKTSPLRLLRPTVSCAYAL